MYFFRPICCHWRIRPFETLIKIEHPFSKISPRFSLSMASILGETYWNGSNHSAALIQINAFEMRIYVYYRHHFSRHPYLSDEIIVIKSRYDLIDSIAVQSQVTGWLFFFSNLRISYIECWFGKVIGNSCHVLNEMPNIVNVNEERKNAHKLLIISYQKLLRILIHFVSMHFLCITNVHLNCWFISSSQEKKKKFIHRNIAH